MAHPGRDPTVYTPAREALIRSDWPSDRAAQLILADFNALPGEKLSMKTVQNFASGIGVYRSPGGKAATLAYSGGCTSHLWSAERTAYLAANWSINQDPHTAAARAQRLDVIRAINAMPGPVVTDKACKQKAMREGISRKPDPKEPEPVRLSGDRAFLAAWQEAGKRLQDVRPRSAPPRQGIMTGPPPDLDQMIATRAEMARQGHMGRMRG